MSNHTWRIIGAAMMVLLAACSGETEPAATPDTADSTSVTTVATETTTATTTAIEPDATAAVLVATAAPTDFALGFDADGSPLDRQVRRGQGVEVAQGQTFSFAEDTTLDTITVKLEARQEPLDNVTVSLEMYGFSGVDDYEPNELIAVEGFENPQLFSLPTGVTGPSYVTFDIADMAVSANQQYGFLIRFADGASGGESWIHHLDADSYPDGMPFSFEGATWKGATITSDLVFFLSTS